MVPARHQTQAAVSLPPHPVSGFACVAERVVGIVTDDDAAEIALVGVPGDPHPRHPVDMGSDPRSEQRLRPAGAEKIEPGLEAQPATRQNRR